MIILVLRTPDVEGFQTPDTVEKKAPIRVSRRLNYAKQSRPDVWAGREEESKDSDIRQDGVLGGVEGGAG